MRLLKGASRDQQFLRGWAGDDAIYPPVHAGAANAAASPNVSVHGIERAAWTFAGTPAQVNVGNTHCIMLGASSGFANQDQTIIGSMGAQAQLEKLPANVVLEEHRRIHWWAWRQRLFGAATGAMKLFCGAHLRSNQLGTGSWGANTFPTVGNGIGLSLDGAGGWQFLRKVNPAISEGASEELSLVWPRSLFAWTEVWFVILGATATQPAKFRLYIDGELTVERPWPDDGAIGSLNPIYNEAGGGSAFIWTARCAGLTFPGTRLLFAGWRYRQGLYDVDGSQLTGL